MKGIISAGGLWKGLCPVSPLRNKHLAFAFNKPMIYYPLSILMLTDVRDVLIICSQEDSEVYKKFFWNGVLNFLPRLVRKNIKFVIDKLLRRSKP